MDIMQIAFEDYRNIKGNLKPGEVCDANRINLGLVKIAEDGDKQTYAGLDGELYNFEKLGGVMIRYVE